MAAELIEAVGRLIFGSLGLRYLFSRNYRKKIHKRWSEQTKLVVVWEVFETLLGLLFLGVIVYAVFYGIFIYKPVT